MSKFHTNDPSAHPTYTLTGMVVGKESLVPLNFDILLLTF